MMTRIGGVLGLLWAGVGSAFRDPFLVLGFSTEGGPYAKIVDVHKGTLPQCNTQVPFVENTSIKTIQSRIIQKNPPT